MKYPYGITSFEQIGLSESIYDVYGLDAEIIAFNNKNLILDNFPKIMYSLLMDDCLVGFYNQEIDNNGFRNRIYPLISVENRTVKKKKTEFEFRLFDIWYGKVLSS